VKVAASTVWEILKDAGIGLARYRPASPARSRAAHATIDADDGNIAW